MLGWSIIARAWRSASKRATTCLVSMPGLMIFRATLRRTGCGLLGDVDDAHAPLADLLPQLVGADDRAGPLGGRLVDRWRRRRRRRGRFEEAARLLHAPAAAPRPARAERASPPQASSRKAVALGRRVDPRRAARKIVDSLWFMASSAPPRSGSPSYPSSARSGADLRHGPRIFRRARPGSPARRQHRS